MDKERKIIEGQLIGTLFYIVVLIISALILYNQYLLQKKEKPFLSTDEVSTLNLLNRVVVLLLVLYFLYASFQNIIITKEKNTDEDNLRYLNLQFLASILTVISAIIVLYVSFDQYQKSLIPISTIENPNL